MKKGDGKDRVNSKKFVKSYIKHEMDVFGGLFNYRSNIDLQVRVA